MEQPWETALAAAARLLRERQPSLVVIHPNPDLDAIGALLAMGQALATLGQERLLASPDPIPAELQILPGLDEVLIAPTSLPPLELVVTIEITGLDRLGALAQPLAERLDRVPVLNIDHHLTNRLFGTVNLVDPSAAAVCELLPDLLRALDVPVTPAIATCLLTGLIADTRSFRTPSTTARTLRVAADLIETGVPFAAITDRVHRTRSACALRLWGEALQAVRCEDGIVWSSLTPAMVAASGASYEAADGLVEFLADTREARVAVLFKDQGDGTVRVSLRSDGRVNVAEVARRFDGGGHPGAAGCTLAGPLAEVERQVLGYLREYLASGPATV